MTNHSTTPDRVPGACITKAVAAVGLVALGLVTLGWPSTSLALGTQGPGAQNPSIELPEVVVHGAAAAVATTPATPLETTWLQGPRFTGFKPGSNGAEPTAITVMHFSGAIVEAIVKPPGGDAIHARLHPRDLIGVQFIERRCWGEGVCASLRYRIARVARDRSRNNMARHSSNDDVWLYDLEYIAAQSPGPTSWRNVCAPAGGQDPVGQDPVQMTGGLFVNERIDPTGAWSPDGYTFSCPSGVIAKCVRTWGYRPWASLTSETGEQVSLRLLHQACVRAARADYCGNGISYTRDGTVIDVADRYGFNLIENAPGFRPEAEFGADGAVSVQRTRWYIGESDLGDQVQLPACWRPRVPTGEDKALITVWSRPTASRISDPARPAPQHPEP